MAIYNGKHCVFEMVGIEPSDTFIWNLQTNVDSDSACNNRSISDVRTITLPARLLLLSGALQDNLTNTTIQTAKNGISETIVSTDDKLFLPALKEIKSSGLSSSVSQENNALITWNYWANHTQNSDRIKYDNSNVAQYYRLRSPNYDANNKSIIINSAGKVSVTETRSYYSISPCFAF